MGKIRTVMFRSQIIVVALILIISAIFSIAIGIYEQIGDGPSYFLMVDSILKDGDFILKNTDISRWDYYCYGNSPFGAHIMVNKNGVLKYAKPILYPLIAAPFFLFFGNIGFSLLNGLFLGGSIALGYFMVSRYFSRANALFITMGFFFCSFIPAYVSWLHPEMMLFFACVLCMRLLLETKLVKFAALVIGIMSTVKIFFLFLFIPLLAVLLPEKRVKELLKAIGMLFFGAGGMLFLNLIFLKQVLSCSEITGLISFRLTPYLSIEQVRDSLSIEPSQFIGFEFNSFGLFLCNAAAFFVGRFTGLIWYAFPAVVCALVYAAYRGRISARERVFGDSVLAAAALLVVTLIIIRPLNYFGGRGFICNRYFFILPALLFLPAIRMVKKPKIFFLLFLPGLLINYQVIKNEFTMKNRVARGYISSLSAHTCVFPFKYAPLEIFQLESLPVHSWEISNNSLVYFPLGLISQKEKKISIDKGQELVIVSENTKDYISLETARGKILLKPRTIWKNKGNNECKSFYYYRALLPTLVNRIIYSPTT